MARWLRFRTRVLKEGHERIDKEKRKVQDKFRYPGKEGTSDRVEKLNV